MPSSRSPLAHATPLRRATTSAARARRTGAATGRKGFADSKELRAALDVVRKKRATRCLGDCRRAGPTSLDDQRWANESWLPRTAALGVRRIAYVLPHSAIARMSLTRAVSRFDGRELAQGQFDGIDAARAWLLSAH